MLYDVVIIGGSYAGMAAALQLVRARRSVLIIDAGKRRNRFASHAYGFLGQDGISPEEIARNARRQLEAYPTLVWREDCAEAISGKIDAFTVKTKAGEGFTGRRLLLATGVVDELPRIPGLAERWGKSVFHCPYCHGYELHQGEIAVIANSMTSVHQAQLISEWGRVTFFPNGAVELPPGVVQKLEEGRITVDDTPVEKLENGADVRLKDGRLLSFAGIFTSPCCILPDPLAEQAGCKLEETPMGIQISTDEEGKTSVPGIFACGDTAQIMHSLSLAVGDGAKTGIQLHRSLITA